MTPAEAHGDSPPAEAPPRAVDGSVSHWIDGLREGDSDAAERLWNRYFARLVPIAQARLARLGRDRSGEDIALSALKSVMIGVREDRFPALADRDGLWPLLVTITARKAISEQRRQLAGSRTPNRECRFEDVQEFVGVEPTPEFAVELVDRLDRLAESLGDADLRRIVELKLGGWTNEEIAADLDCTARTVTRKLTRIRQEWRVESGLPVEDAE